MGKHAKPTPEKRMLRGIRLWMVPVAVTAYWLGQIVHTWAWPHH
ncbi:hypothetical protein [Streptomyces lydicus]